MNFQEIAASRLVENLGWTLLHSLWQIALLAVWLFFALRILSKRSASLRYSVSLAAFALMLVLPVLTFTLLSKNSLSFTPNPALSVGEKAREFGASEEFAEESFVNKNKESGASRENFFISAVGDLPGDFERKFSAVAPLLVGCWLCGVLIFSLRLAGGAWQLRVYRTRGVSLPSPEWRARFAELRSRLRINQSVKLLQSKIVETPMVVGWLKPVVLVPAGVFLRLRADELETVLAHELWHVRRFDYAVNFAQSLVEILFFYHPLARRISARVRCERERACDDAVVRILENSALVYANALASLEEFRLVTKQNAPLLTAADGGQLMNRIERILNRNAETGGGAGASLWSASLALTLISALSLIVFSAGGSLSVNAGAAASASDRKMAIGFVSIPPNDRTANPPKDADGTARLLIEKLKARRIPAIGFLQGGSISDGEKLFPVRAEIVRLWRDAGFEIGIGGFRHIWFYNTPYADYVANAEKNERVARQILAEKNLPLRYFSYPFLNTGRTAEDRSRFEAWLKERGLTPVKYTFDNQEWMYSYAYDAARNDNDVNTMKRIRAEFLDYMTKMLDHYEAYSREMFGRDINQTMVLTPSRLVADSADELFGMMEKRGYGFVSMEEALRDAAYQTPEAHVDSESGISWFERWRMAQGGKLRDEPRVSRTVYEIWQARNKK